MDAGGDRRGWHHTLRCPGFSLSLFVFLFLFSFFFCSLEGGRDSGSDCRCDNIDDDDALPGRGRGLVELGYCGM